MTEFDHVLFDEVAELAEQYLLGELDAEGLARLEQVLREEPAAAEMMLEHMRQAGTMRMVFNEQACFKARVGEVGRDDYLALLRSLEPAGDVPAIDPSIHLVRAAEPEDAVDVGTLSAREMATVSRYLLGKALVSKTAWIGYAAAVALLATVLLIPWGGDGPVVTTPHQADRPTESEQPNPWGAEVSAHPSVATLTGEHDARWSTGPIALGSPLVAHQPMTLEDGFVQITTRDGAVVVLEAPATVELIDDNAVYLHSGKLVGIVQAPRAQGFTVRTALMDVVDTGTRFGVDATSPGLVEAHVIEGTIQAAYTATDGRANSFVDLAVGQAVRADNEHEGLTFVRAAPEAFTATMPRYLPGGTGFGLAQGSTDTNWQIVTVAGTELEQPVHLPVTFPGHGNAASAQWLAVPSRLYEDFGTSRTRGRYTLRGELAFQPSDGVNLIMQLQCDRAATGVRINGQAVEVPPVVNSGFGYAAHMHELAIGGLIRPGTNTIEIDFYDTDANTSVRVGFVQR